MTRLASLWLRLDRWLLRRAWAPTAEGLMWFLFSVVILVQGLLRGFNLVTFIATFLLSMWLVNMLVTLMGGGKLKQVKVRRRFLGMVHAGQPVNINLEINNTGLFSVNGLRLLDKGMAHSHLIGLSHLDPKQSAEVKKQMVPPRRGEYTWQPILLSSGYPFGLYRRTVICPVEEKPALVLPMLGQLDVQQFQRWLRQSKRATSLLTRVRARRSMAPADFYGIRAYRPGDSMRWIHWRTTARVGMPMVREFEEPPQTHITLLVDACLPESEEAMVKAWRMLKVQVARMEHQYDQSSEPVDMSKLKELRARLAASSEPLHHIEQGISLAATLCMIWTRRLGSTITLGILDGQTNLPAVLESGPNLRQLTPMLERLAQVRAAEKVSPKQLLRELQQVIMPPGPILLVSPGNNTSLGMSLTRALGRQVQLLDLSKHQTVKRFFQTQARAEG